MSYKTDAIKKLAIILMQNKKETKENVSTCLRRAIAANLIEGEPEVTLEVEKQMLEDLKYYYGIA